MSCRIKTVKEGSSAVHHGTEGSFVLHIRWRLGCYACFDFPIQTHYALTFGYVESNPGQPNDSDPEPEMLCNEQRIGLPLPRSGPLSVTESLLWSRGLPYREGKGNTSTCTKKSTGERKLLNNKIAILSKYTTLNDSQQELLPKRNVRSQRMSMGESPII